MIYNPKAESPREKAKVVVNVTNYATKELKGATGVDTCNLAARKLKLINQILINWLMFQLV